MCHWFYINSHRLAFSRKENRQKLTNNYRDICMSWHASIWKKVLVLNRNIFRMIFEPTSPGDWIHHHNFSQLALFELCVNEPNLRVHIECNFFLLFVVYTVKSQAATEVKKKLNRATISKNYSEKLFTDSAFRTLVVSLSALPHNWRWDLPSSHTVDELDGSNWDIRW